jgi:FkbM family methyltransferase
VSRKARWRRVGARPTDGAATDGGTTELEAARRSFFDAAGPQTPYVSVEVKGLVFLVTTNDRLGRGLFIRRWRQDIGHLRRAVRVLREHERHRPGSTFIDVGANLGTTTVPAIRWHGFGSAVALEPASSNFRTLRLNLVANDVETKVTALEVAVCNREGDVELALSPRSSGTHGLVSLLPDRRSAETRTVSGVTLDGLAERGVFEPDAVGLLWLDAAGAEALVLEGASTLLGRGVPLVTAVRPKLPAWGQTTESLVRLLTGYNMFVDLRFGRSAPVDTLRPLLESRAKDGDLLAFRT